MVVLNELFITTSDLEEYLVDKDTGLPLANGLIYFYRASAPNELKPIYQISGTFPDYSYTTLPNPMILSAVGTTQNANGDNVVIYYYPWTPDYGDSGTPVLDLYYVKVTDSGGTVQFTRNPWPNISAADNPILNSDNFITNQISNPTFTNTFLNPGISNVYTVSAATLQVFEFAPDWHFVISGTGTVTVQIIPIMGSQNVPTNPPYMLDVSVSEGITVCNLRQRFFANSGLWTSTLNQDVFLYGSFVAQNVLSGTAGITMWYAESTNSYTPIEIVAGSFSSPYQPISGFTASPIPSSSNTGTGPSAYVDIYLSFNSNTHVQVSAIQLIPSAISPANLILPDFDSSNRNEAYQGDYYIPRAASKQINSFLVGWDFPVNPRQFGGSGNVTTTPTYIMDQTIAASAAANVAWSTNAVTKGVGFATSGANEGFYVLQYLNADQVKDIIGNRLSVNVFAYQDASFVTTPVKMQIYLFSAPSTASIPTLSTTIGTIAANGTFTLTVSGWNTVPRSGLPIPQVTLTQITTSTEINSINNDYGFSGWQITDNTQIGNTSLFAIVVTFQCVNSSSEIVVNSISCVPGDLPCRPSVKTFDETLRQCQYYYESNYARGVIPGTSSTTAGALLYEQWHVLSPLGSTPFTTNIYPATILVNYKASKRIAVTPTYYSTAGTLGSFTFIIYNGSSTVSTADLVSTTWNLVANANYNFGLLPADRSTSIGSVSTAAGNTGAVAGVVWFFYVADCRLGIV